VSSAGLVGSLRCLEHKGRLVKGTHVLTRGSAIVQLVLVLMGLNGGEDEILRGMTTMAQDPDRESAHEVMLRIQEFQNRESPPQGTST
jgi:hypothetical protein